MRVFEFLLSLMVLTFIVLPIGVGLLPLYIFVGGSPIFSSERVGRCGRIFIMYKFRSMHVGTPLISTNDLIDSDQFVLPFGKFLRRSSLDELPQLWNVVKGELSLVGPRPCLPSEKSLILERRRNGIHVLQPGLTGYAQVNGRDCLSMEEKISLELYFLKNQSIFLYFKILVKTLYSWLSGSNIHH
jgi:O-antigen biosynthesis protein WbqP